MHDNKPATLATAGDIAERCEVLLINLDRSPDRLAAAQRHFNAVGLPFIRVAGVDASREDLSGCPIDRRSFERIHGRVRIRPGEIGCYQSHLKALRAFVSSGKEFGLILEDDAQPEPHLLQSLATLFAWADDWDIVPLFHFHRGGPVALRRGAGLALNVHMGHISSAAAYLVNRHAAQVLLGHLGVMKACVDHSLFETWRHGLRLRSASPMPVRLAAQAHVSTINVASVDKPPFWRRLPTLLARAHVAVRIFLTALTALTHRSPRSPRPLVRRGG